MQLPIGYDDFRAIIEKRLDLVDKSPFIQEIINDQIAQVIVITRPRRFGKTLNLSMLHYFFAGEVNGVPTKGMFDNLAIAQVDNGEYLQKHQGQYPVIFITFKDIKEANFQNALSVFRLLVAEVCRAHRYLLSSNKLSSDEKNIFQRFLEEQNEQVELERFLRILSELLYKHYNKKVYLLIDEYDSPIQASYINDGEEKNYYQEMIGFMRGLLGAALKTNPYLEKAIITGILRIAKESLFSGLNNIKMYSLLNTKYSQHFGFTEEEVSALLKQANLEARAKDIRRWYNGYRFGKTIVYNPWSIVNCIDEQGELRPYWVNTSDSALIRKLLIEAKNDFKTFFESLLQEKPIELVIDENVVFGDLRNNTLAALSLMLMAGYLKAENTVLNEEGETIYRLAIPNLEVKNLYHKIIKQWLANGYGSLWYNEFLEHLLSGNILELELNLQEIIEQIVSVHDATNRGENFYHGMMLGLIASLNKQEYELKSNRESGFGRYDIIIIPKDTHKLAIILELKYVPNSAKEKDFDLEKLLNQEAKKALEQINQKAYATELHQRGITNIIKIGLAFSGKNFKIQAERNS